MKNTAGSFDFEPSAAAQWNANVYYKFTFNISNPNNSNYAFVVKSIVFYGTGEDTRSVTEMEVTNVPELTGIAFTLQDISQDGIPEIIEDTRMLRDCYCPEARISVLSNATQILRPAVHDALMRVDNNILKLDTVDTSFIIAVDRPCGHYDVAAIVDDLCRFNGHVIIQTMFLAGTDANGRDVSISVRSKS